jgi:hypothetical protein
MATAWQYGDATGGAFGTSLVRGLAAGRDLALAGGLLRLINP